MSNERKPVFLMRDGDSAGGAYFLSLVEDDSGIYFSPNMDGLDREDGAWDGFDDEFVEIDPEFIERQFGRHLLKPGWCQHGRLSLKDKPPAGHTLRRFYIKAKFRLDNGFCSVSVSPGLTCLGDRTEACIPGLRDTLGIEVPETFTWEKGGYLVWKPKGRARKGTTFMEAGR